MPVQPVSRSFNLPNGLQVQAGLHFQNLGIDRPLLMNKLCHYLEDIKKSGSELPVVAHDLGMRCTIDNKIVVLPRLNTHKPNLALANPSYFIVTLPNDEDKYSQEFADAGYAVRYIEIGQSIQNRKGSADMAELFSKCFTFERIRAKINFNIRIPGTNIAQPSILFNCKQPSEPCEKTVAKFKAGFGIYTENDRKNPLSGFSLFAPIGELKKDRLLKSLIVCGHGYRDVMTSEFDVNTLPDSLEVEYLCKPEKILFASLIDVNKYTPYVSLMRKGDSLFIKLSDQAKKDPDAQNYMSLFNVSSPKRVANYALSKLFGNKESLASSLTGLDDTSFDVGYSGILNDINLGDMQTAIRQVATHNSYLATPARNANLETTTFQTSLMMAQALIKSGAQLQNLKLYACLVALNYYDSNSSLAHQQFEETRSEDLLMGRDVPKFFYPQVHSDQGYQLSLTFNQYEQTTSKKRDYAYYPQMSDSSPMSEWKIVDPVTGEFK